MNAIAPSKGNAVAALQNLKAGLRNVISTIPSRSGDPFLRLLKDGQWVYGQENVEVEPGSRWAVNPLSIRHGYVSWTDYGEDSRKANEIVGEMMVPVNEPLFTRDQLSNTGWDWAQQIAMQLRCVSGEDVGTQVLYKVTSVGGMGAAQKLLTAIDAQLDADIDHPVAIVELLTDHYQHKRWGKTYTPVIEVRGWASLDGDMAAEEAEQAAPPRRRRTGKAEQAKAAPVEQAKTAPAEQEPAAKATDELDALRRQMQEEFEAKLASLGLGMPTTTAIGVEPTPTTPVRRRRS